ncbi:polysaccharide deacetylase [Paeniglutamicibacter sp. NPDC091659]|uniref:polysaccharide deacetylase family protein n=1 Tax=Paeniglutamicibacter sp. NPDC091659 TaxID=3364389 RepID=UPI003806C030
MAPWPQNKKFGASITFDFDAEEVWIGENPANAYRPGVLSQGAYGPRVGVPLILDLLARHELQATFFICGKDALRHPESVRSILAAGHEVAHHGHSHTNPTMLHPAAERAELYDGLAVLRALGAEVVGYRSPSWEFTDQTLDLLEEAGFAYSSNLLNDIRPYRHATHDLVEVPVSWILDDAPHFWFANDTWEKTIRSTREVLEVWQPEIDGIAALGGHVMLTFHPMISGRPSRLAMLESIIVGLKNAGAWIGTVRQTAKLVDGKSPTGALSAPEAPTSLPAHLVSAVVGDARLDIAEGDISGRNYRA